MKITLLFLFLLGTVHAEGLYLSPLQPLTPPDLRGMCERFPDSCKSAPIVTKPQEPVVAKPQEQIAPLRSRTTCISGELYYEVITPVGEHVWKYVHDIDGLVKKCKGS